jgi:hypothetical protein
VTNENEGPRLTSLSFNWYSVPAGDLGTIGVYVYGMFATDPEGNGVSSMELLDPTGTYPQATVYAGDNPNTPTVEQFYWMGDTFWSPTGEFLVRMRDGAGNYHSGRIQVLYPGSPATILLPPIVLDLDGDGIELTSPQVAPVQFDMDADGDPELTGWVGADDAFLALDRNGDGAITNGSEISFIDDLPGAVSDLDGLSAFDTDADGFFDSDDQRYGEFRVWQDTNHDGVSQAEELRTLGEHGITAISLTRDLSGGTTDGASGNRITATSDFVRADGTTGVLGDVLLSYASAPQFEILDQQPDQASIVLPEPGDGIPMGQDGIDTVDRAAHDERGDRVSSEPLRHAPGGIKAKADERQQEDAEVPWSSAAQQEQPRPTSRDWRDWLQPDDSQTESGAADAWQATQPGTAPSALHNTLSSVTRRRLQMIEAMAGFTDDDEGAANLSLRPQRSIDARTLELLTSVSQVRASLQ